MRLRHHSHSHSQYCTLPSLLHSRRTREAHHNHHTPNLLSPLFPGYKRECTICEAVLYKHHKIRFCTACHANVCSRCCDVLGANLTVGTGSGRAQSASSSVSRAQSASSSRAVLPLVVPDCKSVTAEATAAHIATDSTALDTSRVTSSACGSEAVAAGDNSSSSSDEEAFPEETISNSASAAARHGASAEPLGSGAPTVTAGERTPVDASQHAPVTDGAPSACLTSTEFAQTSSTGEASGSCTVALDISSGTEHPLADCSEAVTAHSGGGNGPSGSDTAALALPADAQLAGTCCSTTHAAGQESLPGIPIDIRTGTPPGIPTDTHTRAGSGDSCVHTHSSSASVASGGAEPVPASGAGLRERTSAVAALSPAGCSHPEGLWPSHVAGEEWVVVRHAACLMHGPLAAGLKANAGDSGLFVHYYQTHRSSSDTMTGLDWYLGHSTGF